MSELNTVQTKRYRLAVRIVSTLYLIATGIILWLINAAWAYFLMGLTTGRPAWLP